MAFLVAAGLFFPKEKQQEEVTGCTKARQSALQERYINLLCGELVKGWAPCAAVSERDDV